MNVDMDKLVRRAERTQATKYIAVVSATIVYYDYILTFKKEGMLVFPT